MDPQAQREFDTIQTSLNDPSMQAAFARQPALRQQLQGLQDSLIRQHGQGLRYNLPAASAGRSGPSQSPSRMGRAGPPPTGMGGPPPSMGRGGPPIMNRRGATADPPPPNNIRRGRGQRALEDPTQGGLGMCGPGGCEPPRRQQPPRNQGQPQRPPGFQPPPEQFARPLPPNHPRSQRSPPQSQQPPPSEGFGTCGPNGCTPDQNPNLKKPQPQSQHHAPSQGNGNGMNGPNGWNPNLRPPPPPKSQPLDQDTLDLIARAKARKAQEAITGPPKPSPIADPEVEALIARGKARKIKEAQEAKEHEKKAKRDALLPQQKAKKGREVQKAANVAAVKEAKRVTAEAEKMIADSKIALAKRLEEEAEAERVKVEEEQRDSDALMGSLMGVFKPKKVAPIEDSTTRESAAPPASDEEARDRATKAYLEQRSKPVSSNIPPPSISDVDELIARGKERREKAEREKKKNEYEQAAKEKFAARQKAGEDGFVPADDMENVPETPGNEEQTKVEELQTYMSKLQISLDKSEPPAPTPTPARKKYPPRNNPQPTSPPAQPQAPYTSTPPSPKSQPKPRTQAEMFAAREREEAEKEAASNAAIKTPRTQAERFAAQARKEAKDIGYGDDGLEPMMELEEEKKAARPTYLRLKTPPPPEGN